ncbi:uncharacterized protein LOC108341988 isoform X2 [Vigna angularis]|uniref:uncharacterized protein LOC108341988 isoform X2 n=1 Tax=Phaseolus angularis TaxID=3914 RepID=UPI0022B423F0|nr:uncharacterized protein LOC108341988 isoform X2 [Vigna angularis]
MAAILLRKRIRELVGGTFQCPVSGIMRFSVKSKSNNLFVVDSLAMVKRLEEEGISSKQAREITKLVTKVLNDAVVNVSPLRRYLKLICLSLKKRRISRRNEMKPYYAATEFDTTKYLIGTLVSIGALSLGIFLIWNQ